MSLKVYWKIKITSMNKKVFIIHWTEWHPEENWFPYLKEELSNNWYTVYVPQFPTPDNQSLDNWLKIWEIFRDLVDENTIFIGHSSGPVFILNLLEKLDTPIKACYFASWFVSKIWNEYYDNLNETFIEKSFNWEKIKNNCKNFTLFHGDNDPYVSSERAEELAKLLNTTVNYVKWGGHLNEAAGFKEFPQLLNKIKNDKEFA